MNAAFCTFLAMPKENIGTHPATCDCVVQFFSTFPRWTQTQCYMINRAEDFDFVCSKLAIIQDLKNLVIFALNYRRLRKMK